jgi:hypothetical protein
MKNKLLLLIVSILALVSLACRVSINLPFTEVKTGPQQQEQIQVELPANPSMVSDVTLRLGAGELKLRPGDQSYLVEGTVDYNVSDFKPEVKLNNGHVFIEQGSLDLRGIPSFSGKIFNTWDLNLGHVPMNLTIQAGGYQGEIELGGLPIYRLEISDGASEVELDFSVPNPVEMETFRYNTGASNLKIRGLSNANFSDMTFRGGAGNFVLDFSGELHRDAGVQIDSGFSNIRIIIPEGVNAQVTLEGALTNLDARGNWVRQGNTYVAAGSGPLVNIRISMGAGNIELSNR